MNLPTSRPKIVPPPKAIKEIISKISIHPSLLPDCQKIFEDGHLNEAVRKACEKFEKIISQFSGITDKIGSDLMGNVLASLR